MQRFIHKVFIFNFYNSFVKVIIFVPFCTLLKVKYTILLIITHTKTGWLLILGFIGILGLYWC